MTENKSNKLFILITLIIAMSVLFVLTQFADILKINLITYSGIIKNIG